MLMFNYLKINIFILIFFTCLLVVFPLGVFAQEEIEITPHVIDEKLKARDIRKYDIKIKNNGENRASFYVFVNDISPEEGKQEFSSSDLDPSVSLAKWIAIKRGVIEVDSGKEISVPLELNISLSAIPGKRYAAITFAQGSNRPDAERISLSSNQPKLMVNVEVEEQIVEKAQIKKFKTDHNAYFKFPVNFSIEIDNFGNKQISPNGSIYIYNRRGQELDEIKVESGDVVIDSEQTAVLNKEWTGKKPFGKLKAKLSLEYGDGVTRDLQDTIYFWYFPKYFLIICGIMLFGSVFVLTLLIFRKTHHQVFVKEDRDHVLDLRQ